MPIACERPAAQEPPAPFRDIWTYESLARSLEEQTGYRLSVSEVGRIAFTRPLLEGLGTKAQIRNTGLFYLASILEVGNGLILNPPIRFLTFREQPLMWWSNQHGGRLLNLNICDPRGVPLLEMRNNDWVIHPGMRELEARPKRRYLDLRVPGAGVHISLEVHYCSRKTARRKLERWSKRARRDKPLLDREIDDLLEEFNDWPIGWIRLHLEMTHPEVRFTPTESNRSADRLFRSSTSWPKVPRWAANRECGKVENIGHG